MKRSGNPIRPRRSGFTLLELIVVITIIGILGTLVVVNVTGHTKKAREQKIKYDLQKIYEVAESINVQTGYWPETLEELVNAKHPDTGEPIPGALKSIPKDPWGHEYEYELGSDGTPIVRCLGRDNAPGGEDEDRDYTYPPEEDY